MRRAVLTAAAATVALAALLLPAEAARTFPRVQHHRQAKKVVATATVDDASTSYMQDNYNNRTLAIHGYGNGSAGVSAFDIG